MATEIGAQKSHFPPRPAHTFVVAVAILHELKFELLRHPPYSLDLAPCDLFLFTNLKIWLG